MDVLYVAWNFFQRVINEWMPQGSQAFRDLGYL